MSTDRSTPPVAIVTGAARGIGAAIARRLAADGWAVAVNYRSNAERAQALCREIGNRGGHALAIGADVSVAEQAEALVREAEQRLGPVGLLVNNAGQLQDSLLAMMSESQWDQVLDTNLKGAFLVTRAAVRGMIQQRRGRIVSVVSVSGLVGTPGQANYAASKGGLIALTRSLAREVARYGITVNAVAPGFIDTEMLQGMNERRLQELLRQVPLGRIGAADEVAALVAYLASPPAAYITGQTLVIDGGLSV